MYSTPLPSAARASTGSSSNINVPKDQSIRAELKVTASSSPTTLDVLIEHSSDGGTTWFTLKAFAQIGATATGAESVHIPAPHSGVVRAYWTAVGTSYTFSVTLRAE